MFLLFRGDQTTSSLIISHASKIDSGQYQCDPSASYPQHVNVHVIDTGQGRAGQGRFARKQWGKITHFHLLFKKSPPVTTM